MEKTSTRTPKKRATMKCPHSCTKIITPRTRKIPIIVFMNSIYPSPILGRRRRRHCQPLHFFPCHSTRFGIRRKHVAHLLKSHARRSAEHALTHFRDTHARQPAFEE